MVKRWGLAKSRRALQLNFLGEKVFMQEPSLTQFKTLGEILQWAEQAFLQAGLFFGHGTDNAWDDAVALVAYVLKLSVPVPASEATRVLTMAEKEQLLALFRRRLKEGVPVPYLTQEAWFAGLKFVVSSEVIIPRSPIAELIAKRFQPWLSQTERIEILDLCTGSGCIAIACAKTFSESQVDAIDIANSVLEIAKKNVSLHQCQEQVHLIQSDVFSALPHKTYDLIISNPPYVDKREMEKLPKEYQFEPSLALYGGEDGLDIVKRILKEASHYLKPNGLLIVEVGYSKGALEKCYPKVPFMWPTFQNGGMGIFLLTKAQLDEYKTLFI